MNWRYALPHRRSHVIQTVKLPDRTLHASVHKNPAPAEVFLRIKGPGCTLGAPHCMT